MQSAIIDGLKRSRRLGRQVESRIVAAATHDALITGQATIEAMAAACGLLFSGLECVPALERRRRAQCVGSDADRTLPHKGGR
jgi:hypothetical protein